MQITLERTSVPDDGGAHPALDAAYEHMWAHANGIELAVPALGTPDDLPMFGGRVAVAERPESPELNETRNFTKDNAPILAGRLTTPLPDFEIPAANYLG